MLARSEEWTRQALALESNEQQKCYSQIVMRWIKIMQEVIIVSVYGETVDITIHNDQMAACEEY